jgi:hypothetical protein
MSLWGDPILVDISVARLLPSFLIGCQKFHTAPIEITAQIELDSEPSVSSLGVLSLIRVHSWLNGHNLKFRWSGKE